MHSPPPKPHEIISCEETSAFTDTYSNHTTNTQKRIMRKNENENEKKMKMRKQVVLQHNTTHNIITHNIDPYIK